MNLKPRKSFFILAAVVLFAAAFLINPVSLAQTNDQPKPVGLAGDNIQPVPIEVFERLDCAHCQAEKEFLADLKLRRSDFMVTFHDIGDPVNYQHWQQLTTLEKLPKVTPITIVGNTIIQGFSSPETTGVYIEELINARKGKENLTFEEFVARGGSASVTALDGATCSADSVVCPVGSAAVPLLVSLPFFGPIDIQQYSLPTMSVILGFIDGFNPCAMWVLVTFLIVLAQVGSKRKMWQIAGLFIAAEAIMYYLILNVWFTAWDFVGLDQIVTPLVGLVAIGGGIFFLWEFKKSDGTCKVTNVEQKAKLSQQIKKLVNSPFTILTAIGVIALALSVNVIEFACSIGIPQAYTKIIEMNNLSFWSTQWYMSLYILFYMVDDFIVFGIALYSFDKIGITSKYSRWSNLAGGILMILLGLILIFKPSWLLFG